MLNLLLWGFGLSMNTLYKTAAFMDKDFKNRLQERDINIVVKTMDGKTARTYSLKGGRFSSTGSAHADPDLCVFISGLSDLLRILSLKQDKLMRNAVGLIKQDKLKITFKVEEFVWLSRTFLQMLGVYCDRSKPKKFLIINA